MMGNAVAEKEPQQEEVTVEDALASIRGCRLEIAKSRQRRESDAPELRRKVSEALAACDAYLARRFRVLLAEDHALVGPSTKRLLEHAGYEVRLVSTVAAARAALLEGDWAAVVSDGIGGEADPFVVAREARQAGAACVILWTGSLAYEDLEVARRQAGADYALAKGCSGSELVQLLARV